MPNIIEPNNTMNKTYSIYSVKKFTDIHNALNSPKILSLPNLIKELETVDNDYYFRVHPKTQYTFFSDVDGIDTHIDDYLQKFIDFMNTYYDITLSVNDISYTNNKNKKGSYHLAIPKINASTEKLKKIHTNFKNLCFTRGDRFIDTSIYSEHWFRYPKQSKEGDKTQKHEIIKGDMIDFISEYIKDDSININGRSFMKQLQEDVNECIEMFTSHDQYASETNSLSSLVCASEYAQSNKSCNSFQYPTIEEINKALNVLPSYFCDDYDEWIKIGLMLKSNSNYSDNENWIIFDDYSKKSAKYDYNKNIKIWNSFKPDGRLHINTLFYEAKKHGYNKKDDDFIYDDLTNGQYGQAQLFYKFYKDVIVISNKIGYVYDEKTCLWKQKDFHQITNMIPSFIQTKVRQEMIKNNNITPLTQDDQKKQIGRNDELNKLLKQTTYTTHIKNVFEQTKTLFYNEDFIKQLDTDQNLIPVKNNKVVDLRTCTVRQRTKHDKFTFECPVNLLSDDDELEHAHEFFLQVMNNNKENVLFFQKCLGYICSAWTTARILFIFWGIGSNAKSTVCDILALIFGKFLHHY